MGDPTSDYIFSIDPGIVNMGAACYNGVTSDILFADKLTLAPSLKSLDNEAEIIPRVYKLFFDDINSPYKKMIDNSKIVLIENQMRRKMIIIQHVIGAICFEKNIKYEFVAPQCIKTYFNTGKKARANKGVVIKGKKKNHGANKKMGISKAEELFPKYMAKLSVSKQDDVADALLQALWYYETGVDFIAKKELTLSKKREREKESRIVKKVTKKRKVSKK